MKARDTKLPETVQHYTEKDDGNRFVYHQKDLDATQKTVLVMKDAEILVGICDSTGDFDDTSEYQLLIRLLKERPILGDDGVRRLRKKKKLKNHPKSC